MTGALEQGAALFARTAVHQEWIATNLANIQTPGYKRRMATFTLPPENGNRRGPRGAEPDGGIDLSQGDLRQTDATFDLALDGQGFFAIQTPAGVRYTRNGVFGLRTDGTLGDRLGRTVLGTAGPIRLDGSGGPVTVDETGEFFQDGDSKGKLRVVDFANASRLVPEEGSLLQSRPGMVERAAPATRIRQGFREAANVDEMSELVEMLIAMRTLEASQKVTQISNESTSRLVNEK
ncbi:MAG: flagellar hook-basal body complex protein [Planctomycetes bacterium]|nr:flagellar hook-basal body complex protein [Planctomycetota bacterium]MBI3843040.1 flagellar hook-basal body complex protein [Planctomycetota bacterium]